MSIVFTHKARGSQLAGRQQRADARDRKSRRHGGQGRWGGSSFLNYLCCKNVHGQRLRAASVYSPIGLRCSSEGSERKKRLLLWLVSRSLS
jgi:hypothetical protein